MEGESLVGVVGKSDFDLVGGLGVLPASHLVRQPGLVPLVDTIVVCGVIVTLALWRYGSQVSDVKHVESRVAFKVDRVIVVISPEGPGRKEGKCFVEECAIRRCVR